MYSSNALTIEVTNSGGAAQKNMTQKLILKKQLKT
jgi:hypothetical protein